MLKCFLENSLNFAKQSQFRPADSCVNQLLSVTHDIFTLFDDDLEVRVFFLDMSKTFDKVWQNGPIYNLKASCYVF